MRALQSLTPLANCKDSVLSLSFQIDLVQIVYKVRCPINCTMKIITKFAKSVSDCKAVICRQKKPSFSNEELPSFGNEDFAEMHFWSP